MRAQKNRITLNLSIKLDFPTADLPTITNLNIKSLRLVEFLTILLAFRIFEVFFKYKILEIDKFTQIEKLKIREN